MSPSDDDQKVSWRRWSFNAGEEGLGSARGVTVNEMRVAEYLGRPLSGATMDLIELVAAVHLADRGEARPRARKPGDSWSRYLHLIMGVRDPHRWSDPGIYDQLLQLLRWLTDDEWIIEFVPRVAPNRGAECVQFLFETAPAGDVVSLYSGGLDSLAGLAADIARGTTPLAVSVETNNRLAKSQRDVLSSLNMALGTSIIRVPVELHLKSGHAAEASQRARGFGFLALASVVAAVSGLERVHVYENGIGAINLPYTAAQTGAHGTRAMRPETLANAAALFSLVLDHPLSIVNTSQYLTKAEMCTALPTSLHPAVELTESCDTAFAHRGSGAHSCGRCTSCLLRRQALASAGLSGIDHASTYRFDAVTMSDLESDALYNLRAMLGQAARLERSLGSDTTTAWARLIREFPDLIQAVRSLSPSAGVRPQFALTGMLQRYASEWAALPSPLVSHYLDHRQAAA